MVVLVTGGAGYIGSHTIVELQNSGFDVVVADNFSNSDPQVLEAVKKITGKNFAVESIDLSDTGLCEQLFNRYAIDAVVHFAARKYVGESVQQPLEYYKNNFFSTINVLTEMKNRQVPYLVFSSSCTVYGQPQQLPVTEQTPVQPATSPYGNTKQVTEEILRDMCISEKNMHVLALRYFNPIGAHASALIGELPVGVPQNLLPYLTQVAAGKREYLQIFGNSYNTPDGTCLRDYIHVVDLARAHVKALEYMMDGKMTANFDVFNVGTGNPVSVLEIVNTFIKVTGQNLPYKIVDKRPGDVEKVWADTRKANQLLGWKAAYNLEQMLSSAWQWEQTLKTKNKK